MIGTNFLHEDRKTNATHHRENYPSFLVHFLSYLRLRRGLLLQDKIQQEGYHLSRHLPSLDPIYHPREKDVHLCLVQHIAIVLQSEVLCPPILRKPLHPSNQFKLPDNLPFPWDIFRSSNFLRNSSAI